MTDNTGIPTIDDMVRCLNQEVEIIKGKLKNIERMIRNLEKDVK